MEERVVQPQLVTVANGATHDPPQHVAAPFIARQHAVEHQEAGGANMVGNHLLRGAVVRLLPRQRGDGLDEHAKAVDLVVVVGALHQGRDALQTHAGVDTGLGQRRHAAVCVALELHEHHVPDFNPAVAVFIRRTGRPARNVVAVVVENLGARPAGAGVAHGPEVVAGVLGAFVVADAHNAVGRHAHNVFPQRVGLFVGVVNRHQQPRRVDPQPVLRGNEFPSPGNGVLLEIIAKTEVAQHLEKRVVPRGVAHVLEIVVLAAGAHAFLAGGGPAVGALVLPGKHVLERHHAGIGEQQRRVIARHQRRRRHHGVLLGLEKRQKPGAHIVAVHAGSREKRSHSLRKRRPNRTLDPIAENPTGR